MNEGDLQNISNGDIYRLLIAIQKQNEDVLKQNSVIKTNIEEMKRSVDIEIKKLKVDITNLEKENSTLKSQLLETGRRLRKYNIVIHGIKEEIDDNLLQVVLEIIRNKLNIQASTEQIRDAFRLGKKNNKQQRPILVELQSYFLKNEILKNCSKLKGSKIYISQDFTPYDLKVNKVLRDHMLLARNQKYAAKIKNNILIVNGDTYTYEQLVEDTPDLFNKRNIDSELPYYNIKQINSAPATPTLDKQDQEIEFTQTQVESNNIEVNQYLDNNSTTLRQTRNRQNQIPPNLEQAVKKFKTRK